MYKWELEQQQGSFCHSQKDLPCQSQSIPISQAQEWGSNCLDDTSKRELIISSYIKDNLDNSMIQEDVIREGECKRNLIFREQNISFQQQPQALMEAEDKNSSSSSPSSSHTSSNQGTILKKQQKANQDELKQQIQISKLPEFVHNVSVELQNSILQDQDCSPLKKLQAIKLQNRSSVERLSLKPNTLIGSKTPHSLDTSQKGPKKDAFFFQILFYINRFIYKLKRTLIFLRPHQLNSFQLELIGDFAAQNYYQDGFGVPYQVSTAQISVNQETDNQNNNFQQNRQIKNSQSKLLQSLKKRQKQQRVNEKQLKLFLKKISKILHCKYFQGQFRNMQHLIRRVSRNTIEKIHIIDQSSIFYQVWETIIFFCDIFSVVYIPYKYSFQSFSFLDIYFLQVIIPIVYTINIAINCNVSVYYKGTLITQRSNIIFLYLKSYFIIDALSASAPLTHPILFLLRFFNTNYTFEQVRQSMLMNQKMNAVEQFLSLSIKIIFFAHLFSCIWHIIGVYYLQSNEGWISKFEMENQTMEEQYISSFYFAVVTMSTIGYGDIFPQTTGERIFMIFCIFIASGMYGYTLNSIDIWIFGIGTILSNLKNQSENYIKKQAQLEEYLQLHQVDIGLRNRARKYIQYVYEQDSMLKRDGQDNLKLLNSFLKEEIMKDINKKVLQKARVVFKDISQSTKFFERLASILKEQTFGPEELVHISDFQQPPALYIISYGEVELFIRRKGHLSAHQTIKCLGAGETFGQHEFFTNNQENCLSAKSIGVTYISSISLEDFQQILSEFPEEKEKFYNIRDMVLINKHFQLINLCCTSCKSDSHLIDECPYVAYTPIKSTDYHTLLKISKKFEEEELSVIRNKKRANLSQSSLMDLPFITKQIKEFQIEKKDSINELLRYLQMEEDLDEIQESGFGFDIEEGESEIEKHNSGGFQEKKPIDSKFYNCDSPLLKRNPFTRMGSAKKSFKAMRSTGAELMAQKSIDQDNLDSRASFSSLAEQPENSQNSSENFEQEKEREDHKGLNKRRVSQLNAFTTHGRIQEHDEGIFIKQQLQSMNYRKSLPILLGKGYPIDWNGDLNQIPYELLAQKGPEISEKRVRALISLANQNQSYHKQNSLKGQNQQKQRTNNFLIPQQPSTQQQQISIFPQNSLYNQKGVYSNQNPFSVNNTYIPNGSRPSLSSNYQNYLNNMSSSNMKIYGISDDLITQEKTQQQSKQQEKWYFPYLAREEMFDQIKSFSIYFPHNNFEIVSSKWNDKIRSKSFKRGSRKIKKIPYFSDLLNISKQINISQYLSSQIVQTESQKSMVVLK